MFRTLILFIIIAAAAAFAADAGSSAAAFLKIGVGAREVSMGEAVSATPRGPESLYWNPAGLGDTERRAVSFTHNEWLEDVRYEYLGFAWGLPAIGGFGFSAGRLDAGTLEGRNEQGEPTGDFGASDTVLTLGYGRALWRFLSLGVAGEYVISKIDNESASAFAGTAGATSSPLTGLSLGVSAANVGGEMKFVEQGDPLPVAIRGGAAYRLPFGGDANKVTVAADAVKFNDADLNYNTGLEYVFMEVVAARGGYKIGYDQDGVTGGLGVMYAATENVALNADYAYADMGDLGTTHRVTVGVGF